MSVLKVTVKQTTSNGKTSLQGTYQLPGSSVTRLQTKEGNTSFANRANLNSTARRVATALGWTLEYQEPAVKAAAKKSVKAKTSAPSKTAKPIASQTCSQNK